MLAIIVLAACGNQVATGGNGKDNPFADNPPRDITVGVLTLHEAQVFIDFAGGEYRLWFTVSRLPTS